MMVTIAAFSGSGWSSHWWTTSKVKCLGLGWSADASDMRACERAGVEAARAELTLLAGIPRTPVTSFFTPRGQRNGFADERPLVGDQRLELAALILKR